MPDRGLFCSGSFFDTCYHIIPSRVPVKSARFDQTPRVKSTPIPSTATSAMDAQSIGCSTCPFCPFFDLSSGFVLQHVQYCHPENESRLEPTKSSPQVIESMSFSGHADGSDGQLPGFLYHADNTANLEESIRTIAQYTHSPQPHVNSDDFRNKSTSSHTSRNDQMEPSSRINSKRVLNKSTERLGVRCYLSLLLAGLCVFIVAIITINNIYTNKIPDSIQS